MGIQKITFDGANVTSKIDADLYHFLFSKSIGILNGLRSNVSYSLSNNTITFQDGYISIYGRIVYIENNTSVNILLDSSKYGYIVVGFDTSSNTVSIYTKEQTNTYPSLTTATLNIVDGLYEFPLCAYTKTSTTVTLNENFKRSFIEVNQSLINSSKSLIVNELSTKDVSFTLIQSGVYKFTINVDELSKSLVVVMIGNHTTLTIPGQFFFISTSSSKTINYIYGGSYYSLSISYLTDIVTLSCGLTTHKITGIYLYK